MAKYIVVARIPSVFGVSRRFTSIWYSEGYTASRRPTCINAYLTRICSVFEAYLCVSGDARISCVSELYVSYMCRMRRRYH